VNDPHETRPSERIQSSQRTTHEPADELPETDAPSEANPHWDATQLSQNQFWTQKRRLATAMRLVTRRLSRATRPPGSSARRATPANAMPRPFGIIRASGIRSSAASQQMRGWTHAFFDQSPLIGPANPLAPPLTIGRKGDTHARATDLRLGPGGPTGIGTRGFIAAAFGGGPGTVQSSSGRPGMTGTLTRSGTEGPLRCTHLLFEAELERIEARELSTRAVLTAKGFLCAEADGIFVSLRKGVTKRLLDARSDREAQLALPRAPGAEDR